MTTFEEREKGFEAKYQHDQELRFRIQNRRNKLLGLWAAEMMGMKADQAAAYARKVVDADFAEPGDQDVHDKVYEDLHKSGVDLSDHRLRKKMVELIAEAERQIMAEAQ
jgi:hypothetical protein